jgi:hypothetical protein
VPSAAFSRGEDESEQEHQRADCREVCKERSWRGLQGVPARDPCGAGDIEREQEQRSAAEHPDADQPAHHCTGFSSAALLEVDEHPTQRKEQDALEQIGVEMRGHPQRIVQVDVHRDRCVQHGSEAADDPANHTGE